jgi:small-conductance mechanosensitive channel
MRRFALATTLVLASTLGCRKQRSNDTGGADDTTTPPPAAAPAHEAPDTSSGIQTFGFDQRKQFAQSIRQQLTGIDQQISDLAAQAKSRGGAVSDRALASIRTSRKTVDRNLRQVDAATAANWEKVKQGVNSAVDNLTEAIEGAQPK